MKPVLPLFVFIDACGWEIIKNDPFAKTVAPNRKKLGSVFGYSSTCVPSILSGRWPVEHRNWSYFVYDPKNSPFKMLKVLRWLPNKITSRRIFRHWLSKSGYVAATLGVDASANTVTASTIAARAYRAGIEVSVIRYTPAAACSLFITSLFRHRQRYRWPNPAASRS